MKDEQTMTHLKLPNLSRLKKQCRLKHMLETQKEINKIYYKQHWFGWLPQPIRCVLLFVAIVMELCEFLNWLPWKWWKKSQKEANIREAKFELIDILHFWLSLCLEMGMDEDEIYQYYLAKSEENFDRQERGY